MVRALKRNEIVVPAPKYAGVVSSDDLNPDYQVASDLADAVLHNAGLTGKCGYYVQICHTGAVLDDVWVLFYPRSNP